ncbi:hypothetical protein O3P69_013561 [Scylla paramamosain]|uniref:Translation initiation factor eIF2B subunit beta n=1 Tax=Scylla paramamosain TaxID=85552 RepID=A0AAW0S9S6_SCYPA
MAPFEHNAFPSGVSGVWYCVIPPSLLRTTHPACGDLPKCTEVIPELQDRVLEAIGEQKAEVEQSQELIAAQGVSKIHNDEVIVTCAMCPLVLAFLTKAATQRKFHVIVAERAP